MAKGKEEIPQGFMNTHRLVHRLPSLGLFIARQPKEHQETIDLIDDEFDQVGFFAAGGRYRIRSPQEQFDFMQRAARLGLHVLVPHSIEEKTLYLPYYRNAQTIDAFIQTAELSNVRSMIDETFDDLHNAHTRNFIYGDRWAKNILVLEKRGIRMRGIPTVINVNFDLDIAHGDIQVARDFEVAQAAFYVINSLFTRKIPDVHLEDSLGYLAGLITYPDWINLDRVALFTVKEADYLSKTYPDFYPTEINPATQHFANLVSG